METVRVTAHLHQALDLILDRQVGMPDPHEMGARATCHDLATRFHEQVNALAQIGVADAQHDFGVGRHGQLRAELAA